MGLERSVVARLLPNKANKPVTRLAAVKQWCEKQPELEPSIWTGANVM